MSFAAKGLRAGGQYVALLVKCYISFLNLSTLRNHRLLHKTVIVRYFIT